MNLNKQLLFGSLLLLSTLFIQANPDQAIVIGDLNKTGKKLLAKGYTSQAKATFNEALQVAQQINEVEHIAQVNYHLCNTLLREGNAKDALAHCFNTSENIDLHHNSKLWQKSTILTIEAYNALGQRDVAELYDNKLQKFYKDQNNIGELAALLYERARKLHNARRYMMAADTYKKANSLYKEKQDKIGGYKCTDGLGDIYGTLEKYEKAIAYNQAALGYAEALVDNNGIAHSAYQLGENYLPIDEYPNALNAFLTALAAAEALNEKGRVARCLNKVAETHYLEEEFLKALNYIDQSIAIVETIPDEADWKEIYVNVAKIYTKTAEPEKGVNLLSSYIAYRDSVGIAANEAMLDMGNNFGKELALKELQVKDLEKDAQIRWLSQMAVGSLLLLLLALLGMGLYRYKSQRKINALLLQKNEAIEQQNQTLEAVNKSLEEFAFVASHDLKEPLRMIGSYTTLLERRYSNKLDEDGQTFIGFVKEAVVRMHKLLGDMFDYSVISKGKELKLEQVVLNKLLPEVTNSIHAEIEKTGTQLYIGDLPTIAANPSQISQLFQNLITNAIKFRKKEGTAAIEIGCSTDKEQHTFWVRDNGIGISPEYKHKIFEAFKRLHTRDKYEGNGIGLAICNKIVEHHKGKIWVASEEGEGCTFFFTIAKNLGAKENEMPLQNVENMPAELELV